ncbi:MAG TPA: hypothetical protein VK894_04755 [Jiangellales bacterium]|nr:hypothetical protein [Jiangellales bacterium]
MPNPHGDDYADLPDRTRDPAADPAEVGVPGVADDLRHEGSELPEPEVRAVPTEVPVGVTEYGTTAAEQRAGEPMDHKLAREVPDVTAGESPDATRPAEEDALRVEDA